MVYTQYIVYTYYNITVNKCYRILKTNVKQCHALICDSATINKA